MALPLLHSQTAATEYEVKAAFLLNFAKFVEWPEASLAPGAPMVLCIVGDDPFGRTLDQVVEGESVEDHKLHTRRVRSVSEAACQIAYFPRTKESARAAPPVKPGVLTVGEDTDFLRGGMVAFVVENRRVRFDVNLSAMRRAGLKASSRLLSVARAVKP